MLTQYGVSMKLVELLILRISIGANNMLPHQMKNHQVVFTLHVHFLKIVYQIIIMDISSLPYSFINMIHKIAIIIE